MNEKPKVTLLTWTMNPLETVYSVWQASKSEDELVTPFNVKTSVSQEEVERLFRAVIAQRIPIGEHVDFVFMLENVSVSWREQAVRHRIGTLPSPERVGVDIVMDQIPDLPDSSFWSQSMRIQNMSNFARKGAYRLPETVIEAGPEMVSLYKETMRLIERTYAVLVEEGVPMEDARELIPLGAQHRISWRLNIGSLQHIVGKRGCWILQLGIWGPVITGMVNELATKVHPVFRELVAPPCLKGDEFMGCIYHEECRRRYTGDDALPPCPLHLTYHELPAKGLEYVEAQFLYPRMEEMEERAEQYRVFWGRDPYTGERLC